MEHLKAMSVRQRMEQEARKRLASRGCVDPRTGGRCDFDEVRDYDFLLDQELAILAKISLVCL